MSVVASLLLSAALSVRLYNPSPLPAEAKLTCAGDVVRVEPYGVVDLADAHCATVESALPLTVLETRGETVQRAIRSDAECGDATMYAPLFGCKAGTGAAAVPVVSGATYSWSAEGATIVEGAGTPRVGLAFGQAGNVKLTCVITTRECSRIATGVIAVREPLAIAQLVVPQTANADEPVTVTWSYGSSSPASQLLAGDALEAPVVLPANARSYTFTPKRSGARSVELRASYFASIAAEASKGKRRAAGRSAATATDCAAVSATRRVEVKGCSSYEPLITMPQSVDAGVTFEARVELEDGEDSEWSVENGTLIVAHSREGRATIRAAETGEVKITVRVTRGGCSRAATVASQIIPAAQACGVSPAATLSYVSQHCDGAVIRAAFTGTAPFRGTWSDGTTFETHRTSLEHTFTAPGTYGMTAFRDATCIGVVSGAPRVDVLRPTVRLETIGGSCTNAKLVAKLTGTPPFAFRLTNLFFAPEWIATNDSEWVRELKPNETGDWRIDSMRDALCTDQMASSNAVRIEYAPQAEAVAGPSCVFSDFDSPSVWVHFGSGRPPFSVTWSDGVVTTSDTHTFARPVPKPQLPIEEYSIVSATSIGMGCVAELGNRVAKVTYRPPPKIDQARIDPMLCPGETATATLSKLPPPEATLVWTVPGGEILSGQGTPTVTYRHASVTDSLIRAEAVYPDGACSSFDHVMVRFHGLSDVTDFKVSPTIIKKGGTTTLSFTKDRNVNSWAIAPDPFARTGEIGPIDCVNDVCTAKFTDATGPGSVKFELQYSSDCSTGGYESAFATLTILE